MSPTFSRILPILLLCLLTAAVTPGRADDKSGTLHFGVGPLQPTPSETKRAYEPFFAYLAKQLNREFDLVATTDWAGISVALANKQVDLAWMGPWGYILANDDSAVRAIATAKYDGKPIYHAIVVCQQRVAIARALAQHALVILADEPVASLDPESAATVLASLRAVVEAGVAVVASLHQVHRARSHADRILALRAGRFLADAPATYLDVRSIEQIYERAGERSDV
jgi:ABC-type phosphate/phosphonate transport system substrate-binding protein